MQSLSVLCKIILIDKEKWDDLLFQH